MTPQEDIDGNSFHAKLEHMRVHAEDLYDAVTWLDDSDFRHFLSREEQGTNYTSHLYRKLTETIDAFWKFRRLYAYSSVSVPLPT